MGPVPTFPDPLRSEGNPVHSPVVALTGETVRSWDRRDSEPATA